MRNVSTQPPCYLPPGHVLQKSTKSAQKAQKAPRLAIGVCRKVRIKRTKRIKSPHLLFAFVEKCEKSEVSELSPVWGQHSLKTGRSFCLRAKYWRTSRRVIGTLLILPGMASGGHPVVRFFQIVKMLIQEHALSAPCFMAESVTSIVTLPLLYPDHHADKQ